MIKKVLLLTSLMLMVFTGCSHKEDVTVVNENGKYGTLEGDSQVVIKPIYDDISSFDDMKDENIQTDHPNIVNLHWLHNYYGNEYTIVKYKGKYGVVNRENHMVAKPIYDSITKLFNGFSVIKLDNKYGYMNDKFEVVQKPIFKDAREFIEDVAFVQFISDGKWGCITKDMQLKIKDEYDAIYSITDGYARTYKDGKWGYIDSSCNLVAPAKYDYAYDFSKGFAKVIKNGRTAYVDTKGNEITKPLFTSGENF